MISPAEQCHAVIVEGARLDLLRMLAFMDDFARDKGPHFPKFFPLFEDEWDHSDDDILLAAREARALGQVEFYAESEMAKITPAGYAVIRAHDVIAASACGVQSSTTEQPGG